MHKAIIQFASIATLHPSFELLQPELSKCTERHPGKALEFIMELTAEDMVSRDEHVVFLATALVCATYLTAAESTDMGLFRSFVGKVHYLAISHEPQILQNTIYNSLERNYLDQVGLTGRTILHNLMTLSLDRYDDLISTLYNQCDSVKKVHFEAALWQSDGRGLLVLNIALYNNNLKSFREIYELMQNSKIKKFPIDERLIHDYAMILVAVDPQYRAIVKREFSTGLIDVNNRVNGFSIMRFLIELQYSDAIDYLIANTKYKPNIIDMTHSISKENFDIAKKLCSPNAINDCFVVNGVLSAEIKPLLKVLILYRVKDILIDILLLYRPLSWGLFSFSIQQENYFSAILLAKARWHLIAKKGDVDLQASYQESLESITTGCFEIEKLASFDRDRLSEAAVLFALEYKFLLHFISKITKEKDKSVRIEAITLLATLNAIHANSTANIKKALAASLKEEKVTINNSLASIPSHSDEAAERLAAELIEQEAAELRDKPITSAKSSKGKSKGKGKGKKSQDFKREALEEESKKVEDLELAEKDRQDKIAHADLVNREKQVALLLESRRGKEEKKKKKKKSKPAVVITNTDSVKKGRLAVATSPPLTAPPLPATAPQPVTSPLPTISPLPSTPLMPNTASRDDPMAGEKNGSLMLPSLSLSMEALRPYSSFTDDLYNKWQELQEKLVCLVQMLINLNSITSTYQAEAQHYLQVLYIAIPSFFTSHQYLFSLPESETALFVPDMSLISLESLWLEIKGQAEHLIYAPKLHNSLKLDCKRISAIDIIFITPSLLLFKMDYKFLQDFISLLLPYNAKISLNGSLATHAAIMYFYRHANIETKAALSMLIQELSDNVASGDGPDIDIHLNVSDTMVFNCLKLPLEAIARRYPIHQISNYDSGDRQFMKLSCGLIGQPPFEISLAVEAPSTKLSSMFCLSFDLRTQVVFGMSHAECSLQRRLLILSSPSTFNKLLGGAKGYTSVARLYKELSLTMFDHKADPPKFFKLDETALTIMSNVDSKIKEMAVGCYILNYLSGRPFLMLKALMFLKPEEGSENLLIDTLFLHLPGTYDYNIVSHKFKLLLTTKLFTQRNDLLPHVILALLAHCKLENSFISVNEQQASLTMSLERLFPYAYQQINEKRYDPKVLVPIIRKILLRQQFQSPEQEIINLLFPNDEMSELQRVNSLTGTAVPHQPRGKSLTI